MTNIEHLVNRQILRWQEEERITPKPEAGAVEAPHRPMICISREYGARGAAVGKIVADRMGFHLYSRDLVEEIAHEAQVRRQVIESIDEHSRSVVEEMVLTLLSDESFYHTQYLKELSTAVLTLARHGRGVIVGRGAQFILRPEHTLRIRAVASLDVRISRIATRDGIPLSEARAKVLRSDAERNAFCDQHFSVDATDPHHYDLLLNTGTMSEEACAAVVVAAFQARFGRQSLFQGA